MVDSYKPRFISAELRPFAEESTLVITPTGDLYHVEVEPPIVEQLLQRCDGERSIDEIVAGFSNPEMLQEIIQALLEGGSLSLRPPTVDEKDWARFPQNGLNPVQARSTHIILLGDAPLIELMMRCQLTSRFASTTIIEAIELAATLPKYADEQVVVLAVRSFLDTDLFVQVDEQCAASGVRWVPFHLAQGRGWIGPAIQPGHTANYRDLLARRRAAADDAEQFEAITSPPLLPVALPAESELAAMLAMLCIDLERWLVGAPSRFVSVELEVDPLTLECRPYPVLPLPQNVPVDDFHISAEVDANLLFNERSGIILRTAQIGHDPSIPSALMTVQTHVARMDRLFPTWHNDAFSAGSVFYDAQQAYQSAIGEAVERYCGNAMFQAEPIFTSYRELVQAGEYALDPDTLVLFSEQMYNTPGCPFVPFRQDTRTYWVRGHSLTRDCAAWLPASLVYVNWQASGYADNPLTNATYYPGIAAGISFEMAMMSAIQELIERDSTMIWWMNRQPLPAVALPSDLTELWLGSPTELGQHAWAIYLENEFDIPVIAGVVEQTREQFLTIGFACRPEPRQAILKAWAEALTLQEGSRDIQDPDGLTRQSITWGWLPPDALQPWREDRLYLDDYRTDFRDVTQLMAQQQIFLDPRAIERVRPWVDTPASLSFDELPFIENPSLGLYQQRIESHGYEIFYMDVTTPDVALTGFTAVRVIIPGLTPNFPAAFPPAGRRRVQDTPVHLGWRTTPLAEDDLNYMPMPHA